MTTSYHEQSGDDTPRTREYLRLAREAAHGSRPAAKAMTGYWSETTMGTCQVGHCIQNATHFVNNTYVCCFHYSEEITGVLCGCSDDDLADAMAETAQGTYNGATPVASPPGFPDDDNDGPGEDNPPPECTACRTSDYVMSGTHPGLCLGCANARYWGFLSRLEAEPLAWVLPVPVLYCPSCLCVTDQVSADGWRCRNEACGAVTRIGDLLTTSELIKRRAALERIRVNVMERLTCKACGGMHSIQKCPELWSELRADVALGREVCAMQWKKHASFIAMLVNADADRRRHYAYSYVAFIRTHNPATELTAYRLLARWAREMEPEPTPVAMPPASRPASAATSAMGVKTSQNGLFAESGLESRTTR